MFIRAAVTSNLLLPKNFIVVNPLKLSLNHLKHAPHLLKVFNGDHVETLFTLLVHNQILAPFIDKQMLKVGWLRKRLMAKGRGRPFIACEKTSLLAAKPPILDHLESHGVKCETLVLNLKLPAPTDSEM